MMGGGGGGGGGGGIEGGSGAHGAGSSSSGGTHGGLLKKGPWTAAEDEVLMQYVRAHGEGNWNAVQKHSGLNRCGKSCRLRWANHLRPNLKKGSFNHDEERLILELHAKYGNKWARMATQLPGRTDNEIKNYWNTRVKRRKRQGLPLYPNDIHHQQAHIPSPTNITTITTTTPTTPPTTPSTTTSFPFQSPQVQFHHQSNTNNFDPTTTLPFSFQYRPVPLLAAPIPRFKPYPSPSASANTMPPFVQFSSELPSTQFHQIVDAPIPEIHHRIHNGGLLDDILENLLEENNNNNINHTSSSELVPKEEPREHINTLPEDLSKFLNFAPTSGALQAPPVGPPPHWYNHHGGEISTVQLDDNLTVDMQQLASFFPVVSETATSTINYTQNPTSWDSLPGICKGWFKQ